MLENFFSNRAISYQTLFASGDDVALGNLSGTNVNETNAMQINAVFSAVSLIADTISTLPMDVFIRRDGNRVPFRPKPSWVEKPDVDLPREAFYSQIITSLLLDGNAFIRVFSNQQGQVVSLATLNPQKVEVERLSMGRMIFRVEGEDRPLGSDEIIFIPDVVRPGKVRGVSRVKALKENLGLARALESFAATFFGQGTNMNGVIEYPGDLTAEQAQQLTDAFSSNHRGWRRGHKTGVLTGGAQFKAVQTDPEKSQALEARRFAVEDVARAFNVPPHLLGVPGTNSYASVEQTNLAWITHGLRPIVQKIEGGLSPLLARQAGAGDAFLRFNLDGLLRADFNTRMTGYSTGLQAGFLSINDVRRLEDLAPVDDTAAQTPRVPLANVAIEESHVKAQSERVRMAQALVQVGYQPAEVLAALDLPDIAHTGLPSVQLQGVAQVDPENPDSVYKEEVNE